MDLNPEARLVLSRNRLTLLAEAGSPARAYLRCKYWRESWRAAEAVILRAQRSATSPGGQADGPVHFVPFHTSVGRTLFTKHKMLAFRTSLPTKRKQI